MNIGLVLSDERVQNMYHFLRKQNITRLEYEMFLSVTSRRIEEFFITLKRERSSLESRFYFD